MTEFRSIDLTLAVTYGWGQQHGLKLTELQVLQFISMRGLRTEPGMAFAWFPMSGQEAWAADLSVEHAALRKAVYNLRKHGLLEVIQGSSSDERFIFYRGYAIPDYVLQDCRSWHPKTDLKITNSDSHFTPKNEVKFLKADSPCVPTGNKNVPQGNKNVPRGNIRTTLTRTFAAYSIVKAEENQTSHPSGARYAADTDTQPESTNRNAHLNRYEDDWSVPREERERRAKRPPAPSTRLANLFYDLWGQVRVTRKGLATPWSVKVAFITRLKGLVEEHGEDRAEEMIRVFFRLIEHGQISLKSEELWKDFWFQRAMLERMAREKAEAPAPMSVDADEEMDRLRRMVEERRAAQ